MIGTSVEIADGQGAFADLRDEWSELFAGSACSPFSSWEWLSTWYRWFSSGNKPFIVKTYRDGKLIGILPLMMQEKSVLGMRVNRLAFAGDGPGGADYLDLIAASSDIKEVLSATLEFVRSANVDLVCLNNLSSGSQTASFLRTAAHGACSRYTETVTSICPKIDLSEGWDTVLSQGRRASNFKRRLKQLEKLPGFEFRTVTSAKQTGEAFERFLALHEKRWASQGGSELSGHPRLISFQRDLAATMSDTGFLRFDELWVNGACRSSAYGLDDGKTFYYYNAGYDPNWARYSVGLVLAGLSIRAAVERGNLVYDFLRSEETYKYDWANQSQELVAASLIKDTLPARAFSVTRTLSHEAREAAKTLLPAQLAVLLKQWRRRVKRIYLPSNIEMEDVSGVYGS